MTKPDPVETAGRQLRELIARATEELTQELLAETAQPGKTEHYLLEIRIARAADLDPTESVLKARRQGATWQAIGTACGISRQGAYLRWSEHERRRR